MKATGVVRNIDALGRITVPKEIRKVLEIEDDSPLEMFIDDEGIYLKIFRTKCVFCGSNTRNETMGRRVCDSCMEKLRR